MGHMHSRGKGFSASALPYKRTLPSWLKISTQDKMNQTTPLIRRHTVFREDVYRKKRGVRLK